MIAEWGDLPATVQVALTVVICLLPVLMVLVVVIVVGLVRDIARWSRLDQEREKLRLDRERRGA